VDCGAQKGGQEAAQEAGQSGQKPGDEVAKPQFEPASMLAELRTWVEIESPTTDRAAVNRMVDHVERAYGACGAGIERIAGRDGFCDHLIARSRWGGANPGL